MPHSYDTIVLQQDLKSTITKIVDGGRPGCDL